MRCGLRCYLRSSDGREGRSEDDWNNTDTARCQSRHARVRIMCVKLVCYASKKRLNTRATYVLVETVVVTVEATAMSDSSSMPKLAYSPVTVVPVAVLVIVRVVVEGATG